MSDSAPNGDLRFGKVLVRPAARQLVVDGHIAPIGARAFDVLIALVARRDRVVRKDELLELVWPGLIVEENNLQVQISALRKALGAEAIATVPGRGYRFTLVQDAGEAGAAHASASPAERLRSPARSPLVVSLAAALASVVAAGVVAWHVATAPEEEIGGVPLRSALVMPFSAPADDTVLAAAAQWLGDDIARALADSVGYLQIRAPAAIPSQAEQATEPVVLGRLVNVRFVFKGELRRGAGSPELTLRLIDAAVGSEFAHVTEALDARQLGDREAAVRRLTARARGLLSEAIGSVVRTRGEAAASPEDLVDLALNLTIRDQVARLHEQRRLASLAIKRAPDIARAWTTRALAGTLLFFNDFSLDTEVLVAQVDADSFRAVTLAPRDAGAWMARSYALRIRGNMTGSIAALDRAEQLDPTRLAVAIARSWLYLDLGKPEETLKIAQHLKEVLGPLHPDPVLLACGAYLFMGAYDAAVAECERVETSTDVWQIQATQAAAHAMRGDVAKAAAARERLLKAVPGFSISRYQARINPALTPEGRAMEREHFIEGMRRAGVPQ